TDGASLVMENLLEVVVAQAQGDCLQVVDTVLGDEARAPENVEDVVEAGRGIALANGGKRKAAIAQLAGELQGALPGGTLVSRAQPVGGGNRLEQLRPDLARPEQGRLVRLRRRARPIQALP